jgi:hypothetical protein
VKNAQRASRPTTILASVAPPAITRRGQSAAMRSRCTTVTGSPGGTPPEASPRRAGTRVQDRGRVIGRIARGPRVNVLFAGRRRECRVAGERRAALPALEVNGQHVVDITPGLTAASQGKTGGKGLTSGHSTERPPLCLLRVVGPFSACCPSVLWPAARPAPTIRTPIHPTTRARPVGTCTILAVIRQRRL